MFSRRVLPTLACVVSLVLPLLPRASAVAQETNCSPTTVTTLQDAKGRLEAVQAAIALDPSRGPTSPAFVTVASAIAQLEISINAITGRDPCDLSEVETEAFFDGQELAVEQAMDLRSEGFLTGPLVEDAEDAVRRVIAADEVLLLAMLAQLAEAGPLPDDSSADPEFDPDQSLADAQTLQQACELPSETVECAPGDKRCDGSTCDDAIGQYADVYNSIIEIIR